VATVLAFYVIFGLIALIYLYRAGAIYWCAFTLINFMLCKIFINNNYYTFIIWGYAIILLYYNEKFGGAYLENFFPNSRIKIFLDYYRDGAPMQWHVVFNMTILRMISFAIDFKWAKA